MAYLSSVADPYGWSPWRHKALMPITVTDLDGHRVTISPTSGHGIYISDSILASHVRDAFIMQAHALEMDALSSPDGRHEGSGGLQINLLHPSNHCLVYGRSTYSETPHA